MIADVVELVHKENGHAGWDATWKDVSSSYYGILRSDVIFLLKRCQICAENPRKRPKGSTATMPNSRLVDHSGHDLASLDDLSYDDSRVDVLVNGNQLGE